MLSIPALVAVTRHTYAKATDNTSLRAFARQGTQWAAINRLQQGPAGLRYDYALPPRVSVKPAAEEAGVVSATQLSG